MRVQKLVYSSATSVTYYSNVKETYIKLQKCINGGW